MNDVEVISALITSLPQIEAAAKSLRAMGHESGAVHELEHVATLVTTLKDLFGVFSHKAGDNGEGGAKPVGSNVIDPPVETPERAFDPLDLFFKSSPSNPFGIE